MSSIAIKNDPNYGISLEEIINTYGKEYILKYNKNMKGKTFRLIRRKRKFTNFPCFFSIYKIIKKYR